MTNPYVTQTLNTDILQGPKPVDPGLMARIPKTATHKQRNNVRPIFGTAGSAAS